MKVSVVHKIPFHDVDVLRIAWHGHYYKYFELARSRLMSILELDWTDLEVLCVAMPVIESEAKYRNPLVYDQEVEIFAELGSFEYPELVIHYEIRDLLSQKKMATGKTRQIYWDIAKKETLFAVPESILTRLTKVNANA